MPRLPQPGGDTGNWGNLLNEYLSQSHAPDGTIKNDVVTAAQIQDGSVTETLLHMDVRTKLDSVAPTWSTLGGKPAAIGAGASNAAARDAIGAAAKSTLDDLSDAAGYAPMPTGNDDTAALQAAIDSTANDGGGSLRLRSGKTYVVTGLVMKNGVHLDLNGSTIRLANDTIASVIRTLDYETLIGGDSTDGVRDFSITNGILDGNKGGQSGTPSVFPAVLAIYGRRYMLDSLLVVNGQGKGIDSQWSTYSPFLAPNGFESYITRVFVHSCRYDGINFRGPHDTFMQNFFVVKCGDEPGAVPLRFPDASGRANGTNVDKFHVYGGNGYDYALSINSGGLRVSNFVLEGSQTAQVQVLASQVMLDGFHLYTGGISPRSAKGIVFGDASHTGINGSNVRGNIENCGGGALDVTHLGWNNKIDVTHFYYESETPDQADLGVIGTIPLRNSIKFHAVDSGTGSGATFRPSSATISKDIGPHHIDRTRSDDWRSLLELRSEEGTLLWAVDSRGRPVISPTATAPWAGIEAAGGDGSVSVVGNDVAGTISVTTGGSNVNTGTLATLYYTASFSGSGNSFVTLTPCNAAATSLPVYVDADTNQFAIHCTQPPVTSTVYTWNYQVVGA